MTRRELVALLAHLDTLPLCRVRIALESIVLAALVAIETDERVRRTN